MRSRRLFRRIASLALIMCLLPLYGLTQSGGPAESDDLAYGRALDMLITSSKTDTDKLEDISKLLKQAEGYEFGFEYLAFVEALLLVQGTEADGFDRAIDSIQRLSKISDFTHDYYSRLTRSGRPALPDLEKLARYIEARKIEAYGDRESAIVLYEQYPVLDAVDRAGKLTSVIRKDSYERAIAYLIEGSIVSVQQAADLFGELGNYRDSQQRLKECQERMEALATLAPVITIAPTRLPEPTVQPPASLSISVSSGTVTLRWTPVNGADEYRIYRAESPQGSLKLLITMQGIEYSDTSVTAGHTYDYQVAAVRGSHESVLTASVQAVMPSPTPKPTVKPTATIKPTPTLKLPKVGDIITFGHYEQDNNRSNGKEKIVWRVLKVDGDRALLISEQNLDTHPYHLFNTSATWETSTLREWLNSNFINSAFTYEERESILTTSVKSDNNPYYGTDGGRDTKDKVFLLSIEEVVWLFKNDEGRIVKNTAYAKAQGAYTKDKAFGWWWLRSPGGRRSLAANVGTDGSVDRNGDYVVDGRGAVRPALWIDLASYIF